MHNLEFSGAYLRKVNDTHHVHLLTHGDLVMAQITTDLYHLFQRGYRVSYSYNVVIHGSPTSMIFPVSGSMVMLMEPHSFEFPPSSSCSM